MLSIYKISADSLDYCTALLLKRNGECYNETDTLACNRHGIARDPDRYSAALLISVIFN